MFVLNKLSSFELASIYNVTFRVQIHYSNLNCLNFFNNGSNPLKIGTFVIRYISHRNMEQNNYLAT